MDRRDRALAGAMVLAGVAEVLISSPAHPWAHLASALVACGVLVARRSHPVWTVAAQSLVFAAVAAVAEQPLSLPVIAMIVAIYSLADEVPGRRAFLALTIPLAGAFLQAILVDQLDDAVWVAMVIFFPPFVAGRLMQARRGQLAELEAITEALRAEHERAASLAAEAERLRLAREMHDVLSHGVSVALLQAGAGERLLSSDPEGARQAFASIEGAARAALDELDDFLGEVEAPADLEVVVARARAGGLDVSLRRVGRTGQVTPGTAFAAQRIVQEALTNALKYSSGRAEVSVQQGEGAIEIVVEDAGGPGRDLPAGSGRGLEGMRERAAAYGGTLEAGPSAGGGFRVRAVLPVDGGA